MRRIILFPTYILTFIGKMFSPARLILLYLLSIVKVFKPIRIERFSASEQILVKGGILKLDWRVSNKAFVHISGLGIFTNSTSTAIPINFNEASFTLTAYGFLKRKRKSISIKVLEQPMLERSLPILRVPVLQHQETDLRTKQWRFRNVKQSWKITTSNSIKVTSFITK